MIVLETIFLFLAVLLLVPIAVFTLQVIAALPKGSGYLQSEALQSTALQNIKTASRRESIAVLVPAHNEATGITVVLNAIRAQLQEQDRLLVVADNCSDDTAAVASACGAEVIERHDEQLRGKSYALDYGVRHLESAPPDVVIVVDADCLVHEHALAVLAATCMEQGLPAQSLYLMHSPAEAGLKTRVAEFAWHVKNWARPLGYRRLGLPCHLMGTGMAFPWQLIRQANLASGHIVEDLKLGLELAEEGYAPRFCPEALVTSVFPANTEGMQSQRTRWEHGHLNMMLKEGPGQLVKGIAGMNIGLAALVIDMFIPPLALLTLATSALFLLGSILWWATGDAWPWAVALVNLGLLSVAVLLAWARFGRGIIDFSQLAYAPIYAMAKVPLYLKFMVKRQVSWVRSKRDVGRSDNGQPM